MDAPTLLFINGPAGIGKTTIAKRYIDDHPLALLLSADDIIATMGQWLSHEDQGRKLAFSLLTVMADEHLKAGYDVVVPHLLTNDREAEALQNIAAQHDADFFECVLLAPKEEAIERMLERGTWGEPGSPPLTDQDVPIIEDLYIKMERALSQRSRAIHIQSTKGNIDHTYAELKSAMQKDYTKDI